MAKKAVSGNGSIRQRSDGRWEGRISLGRDGSGKRVQKSFYGDTQEEVAKKIRQEREQELLESSEGYRLKKDRQINFLNYFQTYIDNYTKKDIRMVQIALQRFKDFLKDTPEYTKFAIRIGKSQKKL